MNLNKTKALTAIGMILASIAIIILSKNFTLPTGCTATPTSSYFRRDGFYFDTYVSITIYESKYEALLDECMDICAEYEKILSRTDPESELYKLNEHLKASYMIPYKISPALYQCIEGTIQYSKVFGEQYSLLAGGLCDLWNYEKKIIPTDADITKHLESISAFEIALDNNSVRLSDIVTEYLPTNSSIKTSTIPSIDLGASAKGFIADKLCEHLRASGIADAIIDLGGNIVVIGDKVDDSMYKIGIKKPFSIENEVAATLKISDTSLVTSGIYERYFKADDKIYHHILDCQTGYPTDNDILSVTIITKNALQADCYSTGCLLLGKDDALSFINNQEEVECIIIDTDYVIHLSDGLTYENDFIVMK